MIDINVFLEYNYSNIAYGKEQRKTNVRVLRLRLRLPVYSFSVIILIVWFCHISNHADNTYLAPIESLTGQE